MGFFVFFATVPATISSSWSRRGREKQKPRPWPGLRVRSAGEQDTSVRGVHRVRHLVEGLGQVALQRAQRADQADRDDGGDEAVLDGRGARLVADEGREEVKTGIVVTVFTT